MNPSPEILSLAREVQQQISLHLATVLTENAERHRLAADPAYDAYVAQVQRTLAQVAEEATLRELIDEVQRIVPEEMWRQSPRHVLHQAVLYQAVELAERLWRRHLSTDDPRQDDAGSYSAYGLEGGP